MKDTALYTTTTTSTSGSNAASTNGHDDDDDVMMKTNTPTTSSSSSSSLSSQRAKARWRILRQALLTRHDQSKKKKKNDDDDGNNDHDGDDDRVAAATQEYSIHKFPGFQMIPRQIIPRPADCCSSCDEKNRQGEEEEHCDYDLVRYEIPFPVDIPITNRNDDTRSASTCTVAADRVSFPTCIVIQTLEPTSQQDKKIKKKMNIEKELMSHVHYGVDNTENTRVWDCSNVLAFVIFFKRGIKRKMMRRRNVLAFL